MDLSETPTQSFIIRIWIEETAEEAGVALWRGHITHVPSGKRCYAQTLDDILAFIVPYLVAGGVDIGRWWSIKLFMRQLRADLERRQNCH